MTANDPDPTQAWRDVREFYVEFAAKPHWEFLAPMIELVEWLTEDPTASRLYPGTSHEWLTLSLTPGYHPERAFISACSLPDSLFECELYAEVAELVDAVICPETETRVKLTEYISRLKSLPNDQTPRPSSSS